jgi:hypothetical protein
MARAARTRRRRMGPLALMVAGMAATTSVLTAIPVVPAAATATPGHRVADAKDGFSLVLPPGWNQVSLSGSTVGNLIGVSNVDPAIKSALATQAQSDVARNLKFFAVALTQLNGTFLPAIIVGTFIQPAKHPDLKTEMKGFFSVEHASQVKIKNVHLHLGKAVEGTYLLTSNSSGSLPVWETQVYALHAGRVYVATFSALTQPAVELTAAVVMDSWRFTK